MTIFHEIQVMLLYKKDDLVFNNYDWSNTADPAKSQGNPARNIFIRNECNDVLYMINFTSTLMNRTSLTK